MVLDVLYGYSIQIERSGQDFYAHKTGFTQKSLLSALERAGFSKIYSTLGNLEISAVAFKGEPSAEARALFNLPGD
jgi:hypothetical protein